MERSKPLKRRRHTEELKRQVLAECAEAGASVAQIALSHGLNANLVHKWRRFAEPAAAVTKPAVFVPVTVATAPMSGTAGTESIWLELQRGAVNVRVNWPLSAAGQCAAWLREIWR